MQMAPTNNTSQPTMIVASSTRSGIARPFFLDQIFDAVALFQQLALRGLHFFAAEIVDIQSLDNAVLAALAGNRIGIDDPLGYSIAAVGWHSHAHPIARRCAEHPVMHMIDRRRRGGCRGGSAARLDDGGAALLHGGNKTVLEPGLI